MRTQTVYYPSSLKDLDNLNSWDKWEIDNINARSIMENEIDKKWSKLERSELQYYGGPLFQRSFYRLFRRYYQPILEHLRHREDIGESFDCIPSPIESFIDQLVIAKFLYEKRNRKVAKSFVDAGCGIGHTLAWAGILHGISQLHYHGIEIDPEFKVIADFQLKKFPIQFNVKVGDIIKEDYSGYNIIYTYHPIHNDEQMIKFFRRIEQTAKKGTVLIFNLVTYDTRHYVNSSSRFEKTKFDFIYMVK